MRMLEQSGVWRNGKENVGESGSRGGGGSRGKNDGEIGESQQRLFTRVNAVDDMT